MKVSIRSSLMLAALGLATVSSAQAENLKVTMLGTGSPVPSATRFSQATLIEAGEQKLLFDLGRGVTIRLSQLGIPLRDIDASFITHMHSDHIVGLPDIWLTGWLPTPFGSRKGPFTLYGPQGTEDMADHLFQAFSEDIRIRILDEKLSEEDVEFDAHDIEEGVVYEQDGLVVEAFETEHGELIKPTYGYSITYDGKKVVIPSDSVYDPSLAEYISGADVLIHETMIVDDALLDAYPRLNEVLAHHTKPEEAGKLFSDTTPGVAAYHHIIVLEEGGGYELPADEIERLTRTTYDGPLVIGEDLMSFDIGDDSIAIKDGEGSHVVSYDRNSLE